MVDRSIGWLKIASWTLCVSSFALFACGDDDTDPDMPRSDNEAPICVLTMPTTARVGVPVLLDGSASSDSDGMLEGYLFEITAYNEPIEVVLAAASSQLFHTFENSGRFEVILTVVDNDGTKASDAVIIDVSQ
jgi:hypothetical protein